MHQLSPPVAPPNPPACTHREPQTTPIERAKAHEQTAPGVHRTPPIQPKRHEQKQQRVTTRGKVAMPPSAPSDPACSRHCTTSNIKMLKQEHRTSTPKNTRAATDLATCVTPSLSRPHQCRAKGREQRKEQLPERAPATPRSSSQISRSYAAWTLRHSTTEPLSTLTEARAHRPVVRQRSPNCTDQKRKGHILSTHAPPERARPSTKL